MEQITISGDEWEDDKCVVMKAGHSLQISLKKKIVNSLDLKDRDEVKIYVRKVREGVPKKRERINDRPFESKQP